MRNYFQERVEKAGEKLQGEEALYLNLPEEIFYLTGFTGDDSTLILSKNKLYFITDGRYTEQFRLERQVEAEVVEVKAGRRLFAVLKEIITGCGIKRILISKSEISLEFSEALLKSLQPYEVTIENTSIIKDLRIRKDDYEIELIRHNLMITELGYHMILPLIKEGRKEYEIAADLEYFLKKKGAKRPSFDTIVASGERSAFPHGSATDKKIDKDGIILLDFGIFKDGYCSDFTRCYYLGKIINAKIDLIHSIVLDALKKAEGVISEGVRAFEVHEAAMGVIKEAGYGEYFTHSTGHGVGLQIHEAPAVTADSDVTLSEGMIITVEPGIYLPGTGGVRLEDMVLVKKDGCEVLTSSGYEL